MRGGGFSIIFIAGDVAGRGLAGFALERAEGAVVTDIDLVKRELWVREKRSGLKIWSIPTPTLREHIKWLLGTLFWSVLMGLCVVFEGFTPDGDLTSAGLVAIVVLVLLNCAFVYSFHQISTIPPTFQLTSTMLRFGMRSVPLEAVQAVTFVIADARKSYLELLLKAEAVRFTCDLSAEGGDALVRVLCHHIQHRKDLLVAGEADLQQAPIPPRLTTTRRK